MKNTWRFNGNEKNYLDEVISGNMISSTSGNMNQRFEKAFAEYAQVDYAITFNSGTSTLHAALHACEVHAQDEVIIPPLTVISNADVVFAQHAIPVFCDVGVYMEYVTRKSRSINNRKNKGNNAGITLWSKCRFRSI